MGLAVLPSRLKEELKACKEHILRHEDLALDPLTEKHKAWVESFIGNYHSVNADNIEEILRKEVGVTFQHVLECAGVYKQNEEGREGLRRFVLAVNSK